MAVQAVNLPLADIAFAEVMAERLELPVVVDNDANCAVLAEARAGAARGAPRSSCSRSGPASAAGWCLRGEVYRGWIGGGAEIGHMVVDMHGRPCQGNCPNWGCLESVASGSALVREASLSVARRPDTALGLALEAGRELTGPMITELARDGDPVAPAAIETIGRGARRRHRERREHLQPAGRRDRRGRVRGRRPAARSGARGGGAAGAGPGPRRRAHRGRRLRRRGGHGRRRARCAPRGDGVRPPRRRAPLLLASPRAPGAARSTGGRLIVCPTPIGNLEDVTLRVLAALRDADVVACEDTRRTRVLLERYGVQAALVSYHEHNERERAAELVGRMQEGAVVALVSDAGMPLVSDPGYVLVQGCVAAGLSVEVLPGPSAALAALVASALPADAWRFAGFLPRKRNALLEVFASPETVVAFESPRRVAASLAALAEVDPDRPVAVCRELTKIHEEIVRGTAGELAARYAEAPPGRGRPRVRRRAAAQGRRPRRGRRRPAPDRRRRPAARRRERGRRAHRQPGQRALPLRAPVVAAPRAARSHRPVAPPAAAPRLAARRRSASQSRSSARRRPR